MKNYIDVGKLFTCDCGENVFRLVSYEDRPTVMFENITTEERQTWPVGSLQEEAFKRLRIDEKGGSE